VWLSVPTKRVGQEPLFTVFLACVDDLAQVLEVDLMDDPRSRRDNVEVLEGLLGPLDRTISLFVSLVLEFDVLFVGVLAAEVVDLDAVVDHEVAWDFGFDDRGLLARAIRSRAQRREVHDCGNAGQILKNDARGLEGDLDVGDVRFPRGRVFDVLSRNHLAVGISEDGLEQHPNAHGQFFEVTEALLLEDREIGHLVGLAVVFELPDCVRELVDCHTSPSNRGYSSPRELSEESLYALYECLWHELERQSARKTSQRR